MAASQKLQLVIEAENRANAAFAAVGADLEKINNKLEALKPTFQKMAAVGTVAFGGIALAVKQSVGAYIESEEQLARVDQSIKNTISLIGGSFEELSQEARKFGSELQRVSGIGDEAGAEGFAKMLLTAGGDVLEATKMATLAADLSIAKQIDYATAVKAVSMLQAGNTKVLKEYGIVLDENATKEEATAALMEVVGGQAEAFGKTMSGQMSILKQSFGDLQEEIGKAFAPALQEVLEKIKPVLEQMILWASQNPELVAKITMVAAAVAAFVAVLGTIGLVLPAVITGISLMLGPLGLVVLAIGAAIAIGVQLYRHWDEVKLKATEIWGQVQNTFATFVESVQGAVTQLSEFMTAAWQGIQDGFVVAVNFLIGLWATLLDFLFPGWEETIMKIWEVGSDILNKLVVFFGGSVVDPMRSKWQGALTYMGELWGNIWAQMKVVFEVIWDGIKEKFTAVTDFIQKGIDKLLGPLERIIELTQKAFGMAAGAISGAISGVINRGSQITGVNDAIISPDGKIITTHPDDYLIATKNPGALGGGGITLNVVVNGDISGDEAMEKFTRMLMGELKQNLKLS